MSPQETNMTSDTLLKVEHLSMKFGGIDGHQRLLFEAKRGDITALIGPNGAGKTTVFNCITGFYKPTMGMITMQQKSGKEWLLERLNDFRISKIAKVARTFQNIRLFPGMTVLENLMVAQHNKLMRASGFTILGLFGVPAIAAEAKSSIDLARYWLDQADLIDRADDPPAICLTVTSVAWKLRERCVPNRSFCASTSRLPVSMPA
jgi:branched-chain amino acid transport system ATP-binding protein